MSARARLPARYPPHGAWPAVLRADMAAAFLDYQDTRELAAAVTRGEAPAPTATRRSGASREPIWARTAVERFVAKVNGVVNDSAVEVENIRDLV